MHVEIIQRKFPASSKGREAKSWQNPIPPRQNNNVKKDDPPILNAIYKEKIDSTQRKYVFANHPR
jgi:hypothetical protein